MGKLLEVKNISFGYDENKILKGVSVDIFENEKIAVMGQNGAGKSTFLLNINGVFSPDSGEIILNEIKINDMNLNELRKNVGFVFQNADDQIIAPTVKSEISFGPMNLRLPKNEVISRVYDAMGYLDLTQMADRPPHYLSGGEKKRVSIADIIAMKSKIMIFDEPMAALDNVNAENVEKILNWLHLDGSTLIVATHDTDFAYRFADRIIVFSDGEIIGDGSAEEIFSNDTLLKKAHLKKPCIMQIYDTMVHKGFLHKRGIKPKNTKDLLNIIKEEQK